MSKVLVDGVGQATHSLQTAFDQHTVIGEWTWDLDRAEITADPLVALMFGVDPVLAAAGLPTSSYVAAIHPDDRARLELITERATREGTAYTTSYRVSSRDGIERWVLARGNFERDEAGIPNRCHGIIVDITPVLGGDEQSIALSSSFDPLQRATDLCIAARYEFDRLRDRQLVSLLNDVLRELGRRIARRLETGPRRDLH